MAAYAVSETRHLAIALDADVATKILTAFSSSSALRRTSASGFVVAKMFRLMAAACSRAIAAAMVAATVTKKEGDESTRWRLR